MTPEIRRVLLDLRTQLDQQHAAVQCAVNNLESRLLASPPGQEALPHLTNEAIDRVLDDILSKSGGPLWSRNEAREQVRLLLHRASGLPPVDAQNKKP